VSGFACEHALTRSVRDSAALLDAVAGPSLGDPYRVPPPPRPFLDEVGAAPGRLRIAVATRPRGGQRVHPAWRGAAERAARLLEELGHTVEEAAPDGLDDPAYGPSLQTVYRGAVAWIVQGWCRRMGRGPAEDQIEPQTRVYLEEGRAVGAGDYLGAVQQLQRICRRVATWFGSYDAWLTPTLGAPPPPLGELTGTASEPLRGSRNAGAYLMFDAELANVSGNPAMSVPFGFDHDGLPLAVHVLGRYGDESTLFRLAAQLEQAMPWAGRRPDPLLTTKPRHAQRPDR
jgi:amidase